MSKYEPLLAFLKKQTFPNVPMTFGMIEKVLGQKLPTSAYDYPAWWANDAGKSHVQSKAWLDAGYQTESVNRVAGTVVFRRNHASVPPAQSGMQEGNRAFRHRDDATGRNVHPLIGALKGTFTIEPGYDLTQPALDPEEMAQWDAGLDAKVDLLHISLRKA